MLGLTIGAVGDYHSGVSFECEFKYFAAIVLRGLFGVTLAVAFIVAIAPDQLVVLVCLCESVYDVQNAARHFGQGALDVFDECFVGGGCFIRRVDNDNAAALLCDQLVVAFELVAPWVVEVQLFCAIIEADCTRLTRSLGLFV